MAYDFYSNDPNQGQSGKGYYKPTFVNGNWYQEWIPSTAATPGNKDISLPGNLQSTLDTLNQLNLQAQKNALAARIPNATGLEEQSSSNIGSALKGQLPADVISQIKQQQAENAIGSGLSGSGASNAAYLRAIGLNSLGMQNTGQGWLSGALARNPAAPLYDPTNLIITPYQQEQLALQQQGLSQQAMGMLLNRNRTSDPFAGMYGHPAASGSYGGAGAGAGNYTQPNWSQIFTGGGTGGYGTGAATPSTGGSSSSTYTSPQYNYSQNANGGYTLGTPAFLPPNTYYNPSNDTDYYNPLGDAFGTGWTY